MYLIIQHDISKTCTNTCSSFTHCYDLPRISMNWLWTAPTILNQRKSKYFLLHRSCVRVEASWAIVLACSSMVCWQDSIVLAPWSKDLVNFACHMGWHMVQCGLLLEMWFKNILMCNKWHKALISHSKRCHVSWGPCYNIKTNTVIFWEPQYVYS